MDDTVRIEPGYHIIDTQAWVNQRTSAPVTELTAALNEFCDHEVFDDLHIHLDTSARMQLWAAARGWTTSPETTYHHTHDELSDHVSIVLATDPDRCAYALVQVDHDTPDVYLDLTTDDDYWAQVEPVDIVCTTGNHRWTWLNQYVRHVSRMSAAALSEGGSTDVEGVVPGPVREDRPRLGVRRG